MGFGYGLWYVFGTGLCGTGGGLYGTLLHFLNRGHQTTEAPDNNDLIEIILERR